MGIRFLCHDCDRKLNVKDFLAGKRGICPHCGASVMIPMESQIPSSKQSAAGAADSPGSPEAREAAGKSVVIKTRRENDTNDEIVKFPTADSSVKPPATSVAQSALADPIDESPDAIWYVRPPSGGQYGPADGDVMRRWISEKRVSAEGLVWREGWPEWKKGREVFPQLSGQPTPPADVEVSVPAPSTISTTATNSVNTANSGGSRETVGTSSSRKNKKQGVGIAAIIVLGVLIAVLTVTLVVIVANKS